MKALLSAAILAAVCSVWASEDPRIECPDRQFAYEGKCATYPVLVKSVEPEYPAKAKKENVKGKVVIQAVVEADGTISNVELLTEQPKGWEFADAAVNWFPQRLYKPALIEGKPHSVYFTIRTYFSPEDTEPKK